MPDWKQLTKQPAGSLPPGLLTKVIIVLGTVLVLALILSTGFSGGGDEEAANAEQAPGVEAAVGRAVDRQLETAIDQQERRAAAQAQAAEREAARRLDELARARGAAAQNPTLDPALLIPDSSGNLPDPAAAEIRRNLQLEDIERRIRSIRSEPLVQTFRDRSGRSTGGGGETPPGVGEGDPAQAFLRGLTPAVPGGGATPAAGELDIPLPNSARLPDYDNPPHLISPDDPAGWERVYEGSFLEAVLVTQLSGEFPGPVLATVAVPFYSADRQRVLIPRGTRIIGTAQAVRRRDQARLAVGFHRLVLLDGRHLPLRFLGLNQLGEAGLVDQVDRHYMSTFFAAGAVGILSGLSLARGNPYAGGGDGALANAGSGIAGTGDRILDRFLNRFPTVTIRAGHRLRVWFTSDALIPRPPA